MIWIHSPLVLFAECGQLAIATPSLWMLVILGSELHGLQTTLPDLPTVLIDRAEGLLQSKRLGMARMISHLRTQIKNES